MVQARYMCSRMRARKMSEAEVRKLAEESSNRPRMVPLLQHTACTRADRCSFHHWSAQREGGNWQNWQVHSPTCTVLTASERRKAL